MKNYSIESFLDNLNSNLANISISNKIKKYEVVGGQGKDLMIFNAAGIKEENVTVNLRANPYYGAYLEISAETHNNTLNKDYSFQEKVVIDASLYKEINYFMEDGLLIIELIMNSPEIEKIKISQKYR